MIKKLFLLTLFVFSCTSINAQEVIPKTNKTNKKNIKKSKLKEVQRPAICNVTRSDEIKSVADDKIINPWKLKQVKKEIAIYTTCIPENIYIISGVLKAGKFEYIACACGTKVLYKTDYGMRLRSVTQITETVFEPRR